MKGLHAVQELIVGYVILGTMRILDIAGVATQTPARQTGANKINYTISQKQ